MSYYTGQGVLTISLDTEYNLSGATVTRILYKKPDGTTGYWTAGTSGTSLTYNVSNTDIDIAGLWELQAYVEFSGEKAYGEKIFQHFKTPIS